MLAISLSTVAQARPLARSAVIVRQNLMKPGKNYYKHNITTAVTWWHVDHTHKTFKQYDLYCDLGWDENKQGQIMIAK